MTPQIAAMRIGRDLNSSEDGIDALIASMGNLMSTMATARVATGSPAATGHRAIAFVASANAKMIEAKTDLLRAHEQLRRIAETADTPMECPEEWTGADLSDERREVA